MFKKKSKKETFSGGSYQYIYTVYDKVSKLYRGTFYHNTDEEMIKVSLPTLLIEFALRDIIIYRVGRFNTSNGDIEGLNHKVIDTSCYLFPHSRLSPEGENITLEDVEKAVKSEVSQIKEKNNKSEVSA